MLLRLFYGVGHLKGVWTSFCLPAKIGELEMVLRKLYMPSLLALKSIISVYVFVYIYVHVYTYAGTDKQSIHVKESQEIIQLCTPRLESFGLLGFS